MPGRYKWTPVPTWSHGYLRLDPGCEDPFLCLFSDVCSLQVPHWMLPSVLAPVLDAKNKMNIELPCWTIGCTSGLTGGGLALVMIVKSLGRFSGVGDCSPCELNLGVFNSGPYVLHPFPMLFNPCSNYIPVFAPAHSNISTPRPCGPAATLWPKSRNSKLYRRKRGRDHGRRKSG